MKKFTLSAWAITSALIMSAGSPQNVVFQNSSTNFFSIAKNIEQEKANNVKALNIIEKAKFDSSVVALANTEEAEGTEEPGETEENGPLAVYAYPAGTFYTLITATNTTNNRLTGFGGNVLIPYGTTEWTNLTYDPSTGFVIESPESAWKYPLNVYGYQQFSYLFESKDVDLTFKGAPSCLINNPIDVPTLTAAGSTFTPNDGDYTLSMQFGGNGGFNPGVINFYEKNYPYANFNVTSCLANVNSNAYLSSYGYNNLMTAGTESGMYEKVSNQVREDYISKNNLEVPAGAEFCGFGQIFNTGVASPILKSIALDAVAILDEGDEVNFNILDLTHNEYVGGYTFVCEKAVPAGYITTVSVDIFDEETELDYITLKPNTSYLLYVDGVATLKDFNPMLTMFDLTNNTQSPEAFQGDIYTLFTSETEGLYALDASLAVYDCAGITTARGYAPSMSWELGIEYPYIVPAYSLISESGTTVDRYEVDETEVSPKFFTANGLSGQISQLQAVSDIDAASLTESIEYSSESLKDALSILIIDGDDVTSSNGVTFKSAEKSVLIQLVGDIAEGSWVKLNNKCASLQINLPAYDTSAIGSVVADGEAVATELYDLQGRKLSGDAQGIVIKKMTMADGSVKTVKVVK